MTEILKFPGVPIKETPIKNINNPAKKIMQMTHDRTIATMNVADTVMNNIADNIKVKEGTARIYQMTDDSVKRIARGRSNGYYEYESTDGIHTELMVLDMAGGVKAMCAIYRAKNGIYTVLNQNTGVWEDYKEHGILSFYKDREKKDALIAYAVNAECCPCEIGQEKAKGFLDKNKRILRVYKGLEGDVTLVTDGEDVTITDVAGSELKEKGRTFYLSFITAQKDTPTVGKMWTVRKARDACRLFMNA